jgi:hypothetical protein
MAVSLKRVRIGQLSICMKLRESRIVRRPKNSVNEGCCEKAVYAL